MRSLAEGGDPWAIPWPCIYEFFSVVTNPKIWKSVASSPDQAWAQLTVWMESPSIRLLAEPDSFPAVLARFAQRARVRGPLIHDARVAAICLAHGVEKLITCDRDFTLFPELATKNPFI
ncbi:MAG: VapC toxin family PIN domain ribonuclease [Acidobacteria bacterium]|nr:MAG: VapC toxin family PIN domain ribonuclease [Acidobacteriota bacterium]